MLGLVGLAIHLPVSTEPPLLLPLVPIALWIVVHAAAERQARATPAPTALPALVRPRTPAL